MPLVGRLHGDPISPAVTVHICVRPGSAAATRAGPVKDSVIRCWTTHTSAPSAGDSATASSVPAWKRGEDATSSGGPGPIVSVHGALREHAPVGRTDHDRELVLEHPMLTPGSAYDTVGTRQADAIERLPSRPARAGSPPPRTEVRPSTIDRQVVLGHPSVGEVFEPQLRRPKLDP